MKTEYDNSFGWFYDNSPIVMIPNICNAYV